MKIRIPWLLQLALIVLAFALLGAWNGQRARVKSYFCWKLWRDDFSLKPVPRG
jgi:hypothetical protein